MLTKINRHRSQTIASRQSRQLVDILAQGGYESFLSSSQGTFLFRIAKLKSKGLAAYRLERLQGDELIITSHFGEEIGTEYLALLIDSYCCLSDETKARIRCIELRPNITEEIHYRSLSKKLCLQGELASLCRQLLRE